MIPSDTKEIKVRKGAERKSRFFFVFVSLRKAQSTRTAKFDPRTLSRKCSRKCTRECTPRVLTVNLTVRTTCTRKCNRSVFTCPISHVLFLAQSVHEYCTEKRSEFRPSKSEERIHIIFLESWQDTKDCLQTNFKRKHFEKITIEFVYA